MSQTEDTLSAATRFLDGRETTMAEVDEIVKDYVRLHKLVNSPEIIDFAKVVQLEAAFQREKWGTEHDGGKDDADWFWLIGYLAGKALHNPGVTEKNADKKRLHRIITVAAAACNWHAAVLRQTNMRPGIEPPKAMTSREDTLCAFCPPASRKPVTTEHLLEHAKHPYSTWLEKQLATEVERLQAENALLRQENPIDHFDSCTAMECPTCHAIMEGE